MSSIISTINIINIIYIINIFSFYFNSLILIVILKSPRQPPYYQANVPSQLKPTHRDMPHLRTSSVSSSIQNLIRKSSLFGSKAHLAHEDDCDNAASTQSIISLPSLGPSGHVHMLPSIPTGMQIDDSIVEWMGRIAEGRPEVVISSSPKTFHVNDAHLADIEPGSVTLNPTAALLFLRILNTKLYGASEKTSYHLSVSVGNAMQATSCQSNTKTGDLFDWFLIDLNQGVNVDDCWIEISITRTEKEPKHKSIRKILGLTSGSKSHSASTHELPSSSSAQGKKVSNLRIPLLSVAFSSDDRFPKPWGTYYLTDCEANNRILGELTFDITESPESFTLSPLLSKSAKTEAKFTAPVTVLRSEGRVAYWQRVTGSIANRELVAFDFQRNTGSSLWTRSLKQVSALDFQKHHPMSIDNVIELTFANGEKLFAYADDEKSGLKWADKLSMAIWGQPFSTEGDATF